MPVEMKNTRLISAIVLCMAFLAASAQHTIRYDANAFRCGDEVSMMTIAPVSVGSAGEDAVWDFSRIEQTGDYPIRFCYGDDEDSLVMLAVHPQKLYRYMLTEDTLKCVGYETPLRLMEYRQPQVVMTYPFEYSERMRSPFLGEGAYCGTNWLRNQGELIVEADGYGCIVLSDDTLKNVLRLHTICTNAMQMNLKGDTSIFDPANLKQEIRESFTWYARGFRYPVFEVSTTTLYNNLKQFSSVTDALCFLPENQKSLNDTVNENIVREDAAGDIIHYNVETEGGHIRIVYTLDHDANVSILLSDRMGLVYRNHVRYEQGGESHEVVFSSEGLVAGVYILYISVNGKVYSEKVNVK